MSHLCGSLWMEEIAAVSFDIAQTKVADSRPKTHQRDMVVASMDGILLHPNAAWLWHHFYP